MDDEAWNSFTGHSVQPPVLDTNSYPAGQNLQVAEAAASWSWNLPVAQGVQLVVLVAKAWPLAQNAHAAEACPYANFTGFDSFDG